MKGIRLKNATIKDIEEILRVESSIGHRNIYSGLANQKEVCEFLADNTVFLIRKNGVVVGDISYKIKSRRHAHISGFAIIPRFQHKGIGRFALATILRKLRGIKRIDLVTHPKNSPAIRLYLSFRFSIESWKNNYYGDGEPRLVLARTF